MTAANESGCLRCAHRNAYTEKLAETCTEKDRVIAGLQEELQSLRTEVDRWRAAEAERQLRRDEEIRARDEERRRQQAKRTLLLQETVLAYPPFEELQKYGIHLQRCTSINELEGPVVYVVHNPTRFDTAAVDNDRWERVVAAAGTRPVIIVAMTPGTVEAVHVSERYGAVVTLFYRGGESFDKPGNWRHEENSNAYARLAQLLSQ
jgi:predicted  nucleic acid-binding Zn-ribbon protein